MKSKSASEKKIREIKRRTRRKYSAEEKIRIVLDGLRGEDSIAALCRREGIQPNLYYKWSKEFMEAGKRRLQGDTIREANSFEVSDMRRESSQLKELVAELYVKSDASVSNATFPVAVCAKTGKQVASVPSSVNVTVVAIAAVPDVF